MVTTVDRLDVVASISLFSDQIGFHQYIAQTFSAEGSRLDKVEFVIDPNGGPGNTQYRVLVTTVAANMNGFHPGTVLFESPLIVDPPTSAQHVVTINTSHLQLTPGLTYAIVFDAFAGNDGVPSSAAFGLSYFSLGPVGTNYPDGYSALLDLPAASGTRAGHFAADWQEIHEQDLSFRLTFSEPGVSITGTGKKDVVDATHKPPGQPLPTEDDDTILGLGGKDRLSGLAGNDSIDGGGGSDKLRGGEDDDTLIGGKGGDKAWGEAGHDSFVLNVKLGQRFDKFKDFAAADDTVILDDAVFKALTPGALPATAFRIGKKAKDDAQKILYDEDSGWVRYDSDGKGGDDPVHVASLPDGLALTAANFMVI